MCGVFSAYAVKCDRRGKTKINIKRLSNIDKNSEKQKAYYVL